ncbi:MAG: hypothetical protein ACI4IQ_01425 [Eubacterium sp.]
MKKAVAIILTVLVYVALCACSQAADNKSVETTESTTQISTTEKRVTSTTAAVSKDTEKGKKLSNAVIKALSSQEGAKVSGNTETGSFQYTYNTRDTSEVYKNEASDEMESLAKKNADKFVDEIKAYYNDEIIFEKTEIQSITSSGENGIESARYIVYYTNSQNQQLIVQTDSDAVISYVTCNFTW